MCLSAWELVPYKVYSIYGDKSLRFVDKRLIDCLSYLRNWYDKPIIVNTKNLQYRGLRTPECAEYKIFSCHSFGRAADFHIKDIPCETVYNDILTDMADDLKTFGLSAVENINDTKTWVHISVSNFNGWQTEEKNGIKILKGK